MTAQQEETLPLRKYMSNCDEAELQLNIRELLFELGYRKVEITHGPLEHGRDIVFMEEDRIGRSIWRGVQVKVTPFSGSSNSLGLRSLISQCADGLGVPHRLSNGQSVQLQEMWVVNSREMSEFAKQKIQEHDLLTNRVHIIDGTDLFELLHEHFPNLASGESRPLQSYLRNLSEYCETPEEYLTARFGRRIPLSQSYVPPRATLQVVDPRVLSSDPPPGSLTSDTSAFLTLASARLLPKQLLRRADELVDKLETVAQTCSTIGATPESVLSDLTRLARRFRQDLRQSITAPERCEVLGAELSADTVRQYCGDFLERLLQRSPKKSLAPIPKLCNAEKSRQRLRTKIDEAEAGRERLVKRVDDLNLKLKERDLNRQDKQKTKADKDKCESQIRELDQSINSNQHEFAALQGRIQELLVERDQCFGRLADSLRGVDDPTAELDEIAESVASFLVDASESIQQSVGETRLKFDILKKLQVIERDLMALYLSQANDVGDMSSDRVIDDSSIETVVRLSEISDTLALFRGFDTGELLRLRVSDPYIVQDHADTIALIGDLGVGKSTVLKRVAHTVASKQNEELPLPVFATLATLSAPNGEIGTRELIRAAKHGFSGLPERLEQGAVWLLDGLDEMQVPETRLSLIAAVSNRSCFNDEAKIWLTSRPWAIKGYLPDIRRIWLEGFGKEQIDRFLERFPWTTDFGRTSLTRALNESIELREMAVKPLLLTLLALLCDGRRGVRLPRRREEVYDRILKLFLGEWDRSKGIKRSYVIDEDDRLVALAGAAYELYAKRLKLFSSQEFVDALSSSLPKLTHNELETCLEEYVRDTVIIEQPGGELAFFHFSIHEYLAALELSRDLSLGRVWGAVTDYFRDGWWGETLVFYAGIRRDVGELIDGLHQHLTSSVGSDSPNLALLLQRWLDVANFTNTEELNPKGSVQVALERLKTDRQG